ncbi:Crp/Fnr family transcriptional regulator [Trinickia symbiotica]|uniref:Crp/Fnr family transcriptional regulator n=3 Tax=Burkholderiaceae TaxID=119060 RepID=A0A2N7WP96_9BURK|nr:Crp/Fnr family transcriptional regulator [Trinickia symbiotica]PTB16757.1 Crp/Fnr family transcriptional regulator [Trinickia symbiotica]
MRPCCTANRAEHADMRSTKGLAPARHVVRRGAPVFRIGDPFTNIYAIRTGSFKKVMLLSDGREQITGFFFAGEPLGLDGVCHAYHMSDAIALEDSCVCVLPFALLELLGRQVKAISDHLYRVFSAELARDSSHMVVLGTMTVEERIATFLLDMSSRQSHQRANSPTQFVLRMTRGEAGSFLGVTMETVCRVLSRFEKRGLIAVGGRNIRILDLDGLLDVSRAE